jgi:heterodisulfide reductase subunit A-like polyferredoxin
MESGFDRSRIALVNIREMCLGLYGNSPESAQDLAVRTILAGFSQLRSDREPRTPVGAIPEEALILGATRAGISAAKRLQGPFRSVVVVDENAPVKRIKQELKVSKIPLIRPAAIIGLEGRRGQFSLVIEEKGTGMSPPCREIRTGVVILGSREYQKIPYRRDPFDEDHRVRRWKAFETHETPIPGVYSAQNARLKKISEETQGDAVAGKVLEDIFTARKRQDMSTALVDTQLCRGCGRCAQVCPEGAAYLQEFGRGVAFSRIDFSLCTGCANCMAECPTGAIGIPEFGQGYFEEVMDVVLG